jgi:hypothetical protein
MSKVRPSLEDQVSSVDEDELPATRFELASAQPAPSVQSPVGQVSSQPDALRMTRARREGKGSGNLATPSISSAAHMAQIKADRDAWLGEKGQLGARAYRIVREALEDEVRARKRKGVPISKEELLNDILIEHYNLVFPG